MKVSCACPSGFILSVDKETCYIVEPMISGNATMDETDMDFKNRRIIVYAITWATFAMILAVGCVVCNVIIEQ